MALKVIKYWWFNSLDKTIGIVSAENEMGCRKLRIGVLNNPSADEEADATFIADMGGKLPVGDLRDMLASLEKGKSFE